MLVQSTSQQLHGHGEDYEDTFKNFEGFSQILKEQSGEKRYLGVFTIPIAIIKKYEKFAIKYFCENEKVSETVFACSFGAQAESFKQKKVKNLLTLSL